MVLYIHLNDVVLNFKNILKSMNFIDFKRPGTELSIYARQSTFLLETCDTLSC